MADAPTIRVEGLRELTSTLRKLSKQFPKEIREINVRRAKEVAGRAKPRAPRLSGRLAASVRGLTTQRDARVAIGRASIPYAGPIYFGWPGHNIEPHPFVDDTISSMRSSLERDYENEMNAFVKEVWNRWG